MWPMDGKLKLGGVLLLCLLLQVVACGHALAAGGEQTASLGTPGQKPLNLLSVTLESGAGVQDAADVPLNPGFLLQFDKNVVNSVIWGNNSRCFSITAANGEYVPVSVTKVDDTIDVSQRQKVFVKPVYALTPGTVYCLKISPELKAKNGVSMGGEGISVTFKTAGEAAAAPLQSGQKGDRPAGTPGVSSTKDTVATQAAADKSGQSPEMKMQNGDNKPEVNNGFKSWFSAIGLCLIAGWIAFEIINRKMNNRAK